MAILNNPGCVEVAANTGLPSCPAAPDKFVGAILIDKSTVFTDAEIATPAALITKLQTLTLTAGKTRAYPIFRFEEITDNSEEETIATLGYGSKQVVKDGKYDWSFRVTKGGLCYQKKLRKFNGVEKKALFIDDNGVIYGTIGANGFTGFSLDFFFAKPFKVADGSNAAIFNVRFALSKPKEFNDTVGFIKTGLDVEESVKGILDLELFLIDNEAGEATIGVRTECDKVNLYDLYADDLADTALWSVTKAGETVAIATVAKVAASEGWKLTFVGDGSHVVTLASAADLATAGIGGTPGNGYEGSLLTVVQPEIVESL